MSAMALPTGPPDRATIDSSRIVEVIHCWPSVRCPAGMKNSIGRSMVTGSPPIVPDTRRKLTVR
ncbi:hypothetical protein LMG26296_05267 [Cupriavidus plantarum]|nr:hypothetical protein LMG26296_05267 [Cupriavidus plantarum]